METSHIKETSIISRGTRKQQENKSSASLRGSRGLFFISLSAAASRPLLLKVLKRCVARPDLVASNERRSSETDKWRKKKDVVARSEMGGGTVREGEMKGEKNRSK